jgi:hypothetical protein
LGFAVLAGLAFLGGILHAPNNYDGLAYRVPRVLHWLAEGQWHWIHTDFQRLNSRTVGIEWLSAPIIAFTGTDRLLFLINTAAFLLLPGLVFSLLHRLGVRRRVAWQWMWLFPSGYCFLLQAGSIGNDLYGTVLVLAAMDFALRARASGRWSDLVISALSAALMTSAKASNLPLALPWLVVVFPAWRLCVRRPLRAVGLVGCCALVSFLPTAALNMKYCGDWTGVAAEPVQMNGQAPMLRLAVNLIQIPMQNLVPPIFPMAGAWNRLMDRLIPSPVSARLLEHFESVPARFQLGEMQMEEGAGLGFGASVLLVGSVVAATRARLRAGRSMARRTGEWFRWLFLAACVVSLLPFLTRSGLGGAARYLSPYYVFLVAPLLAMDGMVRVSGKRWWRVLVGVVFGLAALLLAVSPARPLWPASTVLRSVNAEHSSHPLVRRAWAVYHVYDQRWDAFAAARALLPPGIETLGIVSFDDPETSLWRPFGSRRIVHVPAAETAESVRRQGLKYVLVSEKILSQHRRMTLQEWLSRYDATVADQIRLELRASDGAAEWYLVRLNDRTPTSPSP